MPYNLTVLHSKDAEGTAHLFQEHYGLKYESINLVCLDDLEFPLKPSKLQRLARSKLFTVLISPNFLEFMGREPNGVFSICRSLNPSRTSVVFCNNVKEVDITSCHKAVLLSFDQWSREDFTVSDTKDRDVDLEESFRHLMDNLDSLTTAISNSECNLYQEVKIWMVPEKVSSEQNSVYIIFDEPLAESEKLTVVFETDVTGISFKRLNPYVICFNISDEYFFTSKTILVHIRLGNCTLCTKELFCEQNKAITYRDLIYGSSSPLSFEGTSPGSTNTEMNPEEKEECFLKLCSKYGLEQLATGILEEEGEKEPNRYKSFFDNVFDDASTLCMKAAAEKENPYFDTCNDDIDWIETSSFSPIPLRKHCKEIRRSASEPSIHDAKDKHNTYFNFRMDVEDDVLYLDMSGNPNFKTQDLPGYEKPIRKFQNMDIDVNRDTVESTLSNQIYMSMKFDMKRYEQLLCEDQNPDGKNGVKRFLSNHTYVSMKLEDEQEDEHEDEQENELPPNMINLSESQKELIQLLHAFKRGVKTISQVEKLFQEWHEKHRDSLEEQTYRMKQKYEKVQPSQSFRLPDLKTILLKPKRKESKEQTDVNNKSLNTKYFDVKNENQFEKTISNISVSSSSSRCSIISENSGTLESNNGLTTDSGTHSDATDSSRKERKILEGRSANWFRALTPISRTMYCPLLPYDDECPPTLPLKPPPLPAKRKIQNADKSEKFKKKPEVMPRKKLPRKNRSPSPDYITPNTHKSAPKCCKTESNKTAKKTALLPVGYGKSSGKKENLPTTTDPLRKISTPEIRRCKPDLLDIDDIIIEDLQTAELIGNPKYYQYKLRKSVSYPQLDESKIRQATCIEIPNKPSLVFGSDSNIN